MTHDNYLLATPPNIEMEGDFESSVTYCPNCKSYYDDGIELHNFDDLGIIIEREICEFCSTYEFLNC